MKIAVLKTTRELSEIKPVREISFAKLFTYHRDYVARVSATATVLLSSTVPNLFSLNGWILIFAHVEHESRNEIKKLFAAGTTD